MDEIYNPIIGYEGYYEISNLSNIKSLPRKDKSGRIRGIILKQIACKNGYLEVKLCKNGVSKRLSIHRLVAMHFIENVDNKPAVNHIDGDKHNNISSNLEWCTYKENTQHAISLGNFDPTIKRPHKRYRLSELGLTDILNSNLKNKELAVKHNITQQYVGYLRKLNA